MSWELWLSMRYLWSRNRHPFVGIGGTVSILGIGVGVAALIVVLAVMNGFDEDLRSRIIGTRAHLVVEKDGAFTDFEATAGRVKSLDGVKGVAPYVEGQALVQKADWTQGALVRGVDVEKEKTATDFFDYLTEGTLTDVPGRVVVGSELAKRFHLGVGSSVSIVSLATKKPAAYEVEGIFQSGLYEYDANLIFLNFATAQKLLGFQSAASGLSVAIQDPQKAAEFKTRIQSELQYPYYARTWMEMNKTLFGALKLEKIVMFFILSLIVLVACLNIAGSLTMLVMDKTKDIGILKAIGAASGSIVTIFALDGFLIGAVGAGLGLGAGVGLCELLKWYSFVELPKEIYYFDRLPVAMSWNDTAMIVGVAVFLSFLSAIYPSLLTGRLDPVKALRCE